MYSMNFSFNLNEFTKSVNGCESYYYTGGAYDTESSTITHREKQKIGKREIETTIVDSCFLYHLQFAIDETYYKFRAVNVFINWFETLVKYIKEHSIEHEENPKFIIWVANLSHEWAFIKNYIVERFAITKIFAKTRRDVLLIELDNCIQFRECIGLFGHSLADISKNWCKKYKKLVGDLDYNKVRTFNTELTEFKPYIIKYKLNSKNRIEPIYKYSESDYCKNDVLVLTEMHKNVFNTYIKNGVIYVPYTTTGFVRIKLKDSIEHSEQITNQRENLGGKWLDRTNVQLLKAQNRNIYTTATHWNILRQYAFSGGLSGSNIEYVGKPQKNVKCADITSDYPFQLLTKQFPHGNIKTGGKETFEKIKNTKMWFAIIKFDKWNSKNNHAVFSKHKVLNGPKNNENFARVFGEPQNVVIYNGKIKHAENIVVCINNIDLKTYEMIYDMFGMQVLKCWYFPFKRRLPEWLRQPVIEDYKTKAKLKIQELTDTIEYKDSKARVNSMYGCLACRPNDIFNDIDIEYLFKPEKEYTFSELKNNSWLNPYWAFYITSYARQMLIQYIAKYPNAVIQYDTDSLYFKYKTTQGKALEKELIEYNEKQINENRRIFKDVIDSELLYDLGTWDFDKPLKNFLGMGAKKYIKEEIQKDGTTKIKTVIAGLPKSAVAKMIKEEHIENPFTAFNPVELNTAVIIRHMFADKFASVYSDTTQTTYKQITDYKGETVLQPVTSFHAIVPIDFTLSIAKDFMDHIKQFQKIKKLQ